MEQKQEPHLRNDAEQDDKTAVCRDETEAAFPGSQEEDTDYCWFCGKPVHDKRFYSEHYMSKEVGRDFHEITYERITLSVPRCRECQEIHDDTGSKTVAYVMIAIFAVWIIMVIVAYVADWDGLFSGGFMILYGFIGMVLVNLYFVCYRKRGAKKAGIKDLNNLKGFPPYEYFKSQGYK